MKLCWNSFYLHFSSSRACWRNIPTSLFELKCSIKKLSQINHVQILLIVIELLFQILVQLMQTMITRYKLHLLIYHVLEAFVTRVHHGEQNNMHWEPQFSSNSEECQGIQIAFHVLFEYFLSSHTNPIHCHCARLGYVCCWKFTWKFAFDINPCLTL